MLTNNVEASLAGYLDEILKGIPDGEAFSFTLTPAPDIGLEFDNIVYFIEDYKTSRPGFKFWVAFDYKKKLIRVRVYKQIEK